MPDLLGLSGLPGSATTEAGGLLRVLFLPGPPLPDCHVDLIQTVLLPLNEKTATSERWGGPSLLLWRAPLVVVMVLAQVGLP